MELLSFELPAARGYSCLGDRLLLGPLRAGSGEEVVEGSPRVSEVTVMVLGSRVDFYVRGVSRYACRDAHKLTPERFAMGTSIFLVVAGERLEPR